jgi:hypothetical protein
MMKNVDVEIYINQFISFFEKNPNDLTLLIGDLDKSIFYEKVKIQCYKNFESGDEISLTKQQMIDIVLDIKGGGKPIKPLDIDKIFEKTNYGYFCLN